MSSGERVVTTVVDELATIDVKRKPPAIGDPRPEQTIKEAMRQSAECRAMLGLSRKARRKQGCRYSAAELQAFLDYNAKYYGA